MPPPGSPQLTFQEKRVIAQWIDLGCLVDLSPGVATIADPFDDQMKPSLVISGVAPDYNEHPLETITISVYDLHSGIDADSLSVVVTPRSGPPTANLAAGLTVADGGIHTIPLPALAPDQCHGIAVSAADNRGNISRRDLMVCPLSLRYTHDSVWLRGSTVTLNVTGALPGEGLCLLGSLTGPGLGQHIGALRVDLLDPVVAAGPFPADPSGLQVSEEAAGG
jgi:hypothetical protein